MVYLWPMFTSKKWWFSIAMLNNQRVLVVKKRPIVGIVLLHVRSYNHEVSNIIQYIYIYIQKHYISIINNHCITSIIMSECFMVDPAWPGDSVIWVGGEGVCLDLWGRSWTGARFFLTYQKKWANHGKHQGFHGDLMVVLWWFNRNYLG